MISNKMESNGEPGRIMVSEVTKNLLESAYESEYVFVKGVKVQDIVQGYFILRKFDLFEIEDRISSNMEDNDEGEEDEDEE